MVTWPQGGANKLLRIPPHWDDKCYLFDCTHQEILHILFASYDNVHFFGSAAFYVFRIELKSMQKIIANLLQIIFSKLLQ